MKVTRKFQTEENILIYQMGKVGSSSIEHSISGAIHFHNLYLNPPNPPHYQLLYPSWSSKLKYSLGLMMKRSLIKKRDKVKIITITRCPFERNVSMFFQALPYWMSEYYSGFGVKGRAHNNRQEGFSVLWDCFSQNFNHEYPFTWFDEELKRFSGIDVTDKIFPKEDGYSIYRNGKFEVLLIDLPKIDSLSPVIENFTGSEMALEDTNSGEKKWYKDVYGEFKREYLDLYKREFSYLKGSKYGQWYFSD